jgi:MurNAc alpha-1-phosphate uridylyltransferase
MIFAAGRGTRLGALGESCPKALIEIAGHTMLERTVRSVAAAGADRIVVNVHHHADAIERFIASHDLGVEIRLSREIDQPLETGGGLLHARDLFRRDDPLLLHNVDVICTADLAPLCAALERAGALAVLAVEPRETQRQLLFDDVGLCGREDRRTGVRTESRAPLGPVRALAFAGIQACAPRLPDLITERGVFPIVDVYLRLAAAGHSIQPWLVPGGTWMEIGNPERLADARARLEHSDTA